MSKADLFLSNWRRLKNFLLFALFLLAYTSKNQAQAHQTVTQQAILQGSLQLEPLRVAPGELKDKIQPGTPVSLVVTVENQGQLPSPPGQLYVRYAFAQPLENEARSVLFETEKKPLPAIDPGKQIHITFETPHHIPSLLDFVRYDWAIREYQAIAMVNQESYVIGTLALTFSAYYYPGIKREFSIPLTHQLSSEKGH